MKHFFIHRDKIDSNWLLLVSVYDFQTNGTSHSQGGVVAYTVMQAYGSLALEDNSEIGEAVLGRCSISCVCTSAF